MEILPLEAVIYNQNKVNLKDVIAPPYDVIDERYLDELYERSKYNIARLILTKGSNRYEDAKKYFEDWKKEEILIQTERPSIFYIIQKYKNEKGKLIERKGFIARNKIEDFASKKARRSCRTYDLLIIDATAPFLISDPFSDCPLRAGVFAAAAMDALRAV